MKRIFEVWAEIDISQAGKAWQPIKEFPSKVDALNALQNKPTPVPENSRYPKGYFLWEGVGIRKSKLKLIESEIHE